MSSAQLRRILPRMEVAPVDYFDHPYNKTLTNERCVEVAVALRWIAKHADFVEVGAVMPYYGHRSHPCVDPFDPAANIRKRMEDVDLAGRSILSISSVEHIGTPDYGNTVINPAAAIIALKHLLNVSAECLITVPVGYNQNLDDWLRDNLGRLHCFGYHKVGQQSWRYESEPAHLDYAYGHPFPFANYALFITGWSG